MKRPWVYMSSPPRSPLPPPSPPAPSRSSQSTRSERLSHASNLGWWSVSPLIVYMFRLSFKMKRTSSRAHSKQEVSILTPGLGKYGSFWCSLSSIMEGHIDRMYQILYHQVASKLPFSQTFVFFRTTNSLSSVGFDISRESLGSLIFRTKESFKVTANKNKITANTH